MLMDKKFLRLMFAGRLHPAGWIFVQSGLGVALVCGYFSWKAGAIALVLTLLIAAFFRDPERACPPIEGAVVSPADGLVVSIDMQSPPSELNLPEGSWRKVSIFLNLWDVHVNRIPTTGTIQQKLYKAGQFSHAACPTASHDNERNALVIHTPNGHRIACIQIAGLVARRIICDVQEGDSVTTGQRYGIICFGSRVDCYLPAECTLLVTEGQRMIGGETLIAFLPR